MQWGRNLGPVVACRLFPESIISPRRLLVIGRWQRECALEPNEPSGLKVRSLEYAVHPQETLHGEVEGGYQDRCVPVLWRSSQRMAQRHPVW